MKTAIIGTVVKLEHENTFFDDEPDYVYITDEGDSAFCKNGGSGIDLPDDLIEPLGLKTNQKAKFLLTIETLGV